MIFKAVPKVKHILKWTLGAGLITGGWPTLSDLDERLEL